MVLCDCWPLKGFQGNNRRSSQAGSQNGPPEPTSDQRGLEDKAENVGELRTIKGD